MSVPAASARPVVLADRVATTIVREVVLVLGFALALAVGSRIGLPLGFTPVPVTAQTFVVLVGAAMLGSRRAGAGALTYLALGVAGVPWFAVTGGATLGYLGGFVLAGWIVGRAAETGLLATRLQTLGVMLVASLVIVALGASVLALVVGLTAAQALALGVVPFLAGDAVKIVAATLLIPSLTRRA